MPRIDAVRLRWRCDPRALDSALESFIDETADSTAESMVDTTVDTTVDTNGGDGASVAVDGAFGVTADKGISLLGQDRAIESIRLLSDLGTPGFNLFVLAAPDADHVGAVREQLRVHARKLRTPDEWCYVNNFDDPTRPVCLRVPTGQAIHLRDDVARLIDELRAAIPAVFESDEYRARISQIEGGFGEQQERAFTDLVREAKDHGVALLRTPGGFNFAPARDGEVMPAREFEQLPIEGRDQTAAQIRLLQEKLEQMLRRIVVWRRERREAVRRLNQEVIRLAVGHLVDDMLRQFVLLPAVVNWLESLQRDVVSNAQLFQPELDATPASASGMSEVLPPLRRYVVNVLVSTDTEGAPVVFEENPTLHNLIGRIEHIARFGALVTDFGLIRAGALHRAGGGYLLLDARRVLMQPFAWDALKRALMSREIRIESPAQLYGLVSTVSLEPRPIPFEAKVVLFGDWRLFSLLQALDPDFSLLFKIAADFGEDMPRSSDADARYANMVRNLSVSMGLRSFAPEGLGRLLEWSARQAGDTERLSLRIGRLKDLMVEADLIAGQHNRGLIGHDEVELAERARIRRSDRLRTRMLDRILDGTLKIDTEGRTVGQVNGLAVFNLADYSFGLPTRITATTRPGEGSVLDIQRESQLGGAIHTKGVLILSAYLASRWAARHPLALSATLVFEQTYGEVEGDSASLAELCALLSSLASWPLEQRIAVTGSVNQLGEVQAIGGVNEKIEGFFDVLTARAHEGAVLIPRANLRHLMLRDEVLEAARAGRFSVIAVDNVAQAMAWLTGAGTDEGQSFLSHWQKLEERVSARLRAFAQARSQQATGAVHERRHRKGVV
jgi:predicted ATP-dependent protease